MSSRPVATVLVLLHGLSPFPLTGEVHVPGERIDLLPAPDFKQHVGELDAQKSVSVKPGEVWEITDDKHLRITGKGSGTLRTRSAYHGFHLVLEYKWGEHTWGTWADSARKSGLLIHPPGDLPGLEVVLQEGKSGDLALPNKTTARRASSGADDPPWKDLKGFRAPGDVENPVGEWNRLEVVCQGDSVRVLLNGRKVNEHRGAGIGQGQLALRTRGAELFVRRYELWPIGGFNEKWTPPQRSTDTGYSETGASILPRREPWSPEKSQAAWRIDGDYEMQLVAAEPLVCDPVDVAWDARGRMFVAEMRDYPFPPKRGPRLARIRLLEDLDGDGRMDRARTWADSLNDVQGLLPFEGGLLITCGEGILFLEDSNDDGAADKTTILFTTNKPQHSQLQIASPRWRLDNSIHFNNGIDGKEIRPAGAPEKVVAYRGFNLAYDPRTKSLRKESGVGQFGATLDEFGRLMFCSNRNPAMLSVLPLAIVDRNPFAGFSSTHENIQPSAARIFPVELSHTTSIAHAGTHTSACGLAVYGGNWMPGLRGNLFVCDPTAQLVTRNRLVPNGASLHAKRIGERRDFLVSGDEWCRPVNLRNGPDGALYICDLYRRFIDHAIYFPDEFSKSNYMRTGFDHGRIWRLAPTGAKPRKTEPLPDQSSRLVDELASENSWRRLNAQRLLVSRADRSTIPTLGKLLKESSSALARLHAMWTLQGIHERTGAALSAEEVIRATKDANPGVVENAVTLAAQRADVDLGRDGHVSRLLRHEDARVRALTAALHGDHAEAGELATLIRNDEAGPWARRAVLSISPSTPGAVLAEVLADPGDDLAREVLVEFTAAAAARGEPAELAAPLEAVAKLPAPQQTAVVLGLAQGLPRGRHKSLASFLSKPPESLAHKLKGTEEVLRAARRRAADPDRPSAERIAALALVQQDLFPLAEKMIAPGQPPEIQAAACRTLARLDRNAVADFFFARWNTLAPVPRREALRLLTGNSGTTVRLMKKMKAGEISKSLMPSMSRWSLSRSGSAEIKALALELFGKTETNRAKVISAYQAALKPGEASRGKTVFEKAGCAVCHSSGASLPSVGPDIRDAHIKPQEALLSDILDPNRVVEERWTVYSIATISGDETAGIITSESATTLEVTLATGERQSIPRTQIASLSSSGRSLMPEGLEASISKEEMSDLIAYLKRK